MKLAEIVIDDMGGSPFCKHNFPCPVYLDEHAVLDMSQAIFHPSWKAQKEGWRLVQLKKWQINLLLLLGVKVL